MKKIIVFGFGRGSRDIIETIDEINNFYGPRYKCIGILDDDKSLHGKKIMDVKVIGGIEKAASFRDTFFVNGIYILNDFSKNREIVVKSNIRPEHFETIIHPTARISKSAKIGNGSVIMQNAVLMSGVVVGQHVNIQPGVIISHDTVIEEHSFIANSVSIGGVVKIGEAVFIGLNSSIKENVSIGDFSVIGMGSIVLSNVPSGSVFVGSPARFLKKSK